MRTFARSRKSLLQLSAALSIGVAAALAFGPVNPIGAIINGGETCRSVTPNYRAADTRNGDGGVPVGTVGPGGTLDVRVAGVGSIPADAKSVTIQLTATGLTGVPETFLVAYPAGTAQPPSSSLNPNNEHTTANGAIPVAVGTDGKITVFNERGNTHILVDVLQWCDEHDHDDDYGVGKVAYNTTGTLASTSSTTYGDVASASVMATVKKDGAILVTFSAETECTTTNLTADQCQVKVLVDGATAGPDAVTFDTASMTSGDWESHSHQFVAGPLPAGTYTVKVQTRVDTSGATFTIDNWTLTALPLIP